MVLNFFNTFFNANGYNLFSKNEMEKQNTKTFFTKIIKSCSNHKPYNNIKHNKIQ